MLDDAALALIVRYVSGECSPEEARDVERWIAEDPARARGADRLRELWSQGAALRAADAASADAVNWDTDTAWRTFTAAPPREAKTLRLIPAEASGAARRRRLGLAVAAAATIALAASSALLWRFPENERSGPTGARPPAAREFATAPAQRAEVRLSDGTRAVLAPASRLRMPAGYGVTTRELHLEGEAYFEVRPDPARPFRVRTTRGLIEDVGTKFGVRAYAGDTTELVAVTEGIVMLHAADSAPGARLEAGQLGTRSPSGTPTVTTVADVERYVAWTEGRLVFRDTPLREVVVQLERWYGLDVRLAEPDVGGLLFTGVFRDEPVAEVLRSLEIALDVRAQRGGDVVTLRSNPSRR